MLNYNVATNEHLQVIIPTDEIRSKLLAQLEDVLRHLLPNGKRRYNQYHVGNVQGDSGNSLKIELRDPNAGMWQDFATGEGGDVFELWAKVRGLDAKNDFPRLMEEIKNWLGVYVATKKSYNSMERKAPANDDRGTPTAKWDYTDKDSNITTTVFRYDPKGENKQFRPYDAVSKVYKAPDIRLLYNLPQITNSKTIILVEGEKCAQALIDKEICATTAMFGAKSPLDKTDWSPLKGKNVIIWPDNDAPGKAYAGKVAAFLKNKAIRSIAILDLPANKPEKWDAADAIVDGLDVKKFIEQTTKKTIYSRKIIPFLKTEILRGDKSPIAEDIISPRVLTPNGFMVFGGAPKVGKSDFLLHWMVHMAAGIPFADMTPARPLKICFLQTEIDYDYLRERIHMVGLDENLWQIVDKNLSITPRVNITLNEQGVEELIEDIKDHFQDDKVDIIVIDPLYDVFDNNGSDLGENDNTLMNFFLKNRIEYLCDQINPKAGIIIAHHLRKTTKAAFEEDPFSALAGASCIRRRFTSGLILYCPDENQTLRKLIFEIRNGPKILPKWVDKIGGRWQEIASNSIRVTHQTLGSKHDNERSRKQDKILQLIKKQALAGKIFTMHLFCEKFENKQGLGSSNSIRERLEILATKGFIKFLKKHADLYGLRNPTGSKYGYLCIEGMQLKTEEGEFTIYPTHYKYQGLGDVLEVKNPREWVYYDDD